MIAGMMPDALSMAKFMKLASPGAYDRPENYKAISKVMGSKERKRLDYLTNGLLF